MTQETKNILTLIVIPLIVGMIIRLAFLKKRKGYIVTIATGTISTLMLLMSVTVYTGGNEYLGIWFMISVSVFLGSLIVGLTSLILRKYKRQKCENQDFIPEN